MDLFEACLRVLARVRSPVQSCISQLGFERVCASAIDPPPPVGSSSLYLLRAVRVGLLTPITGLQLRHKNRLSSAATGSLYVLRGVPPLSAALGCTSVRVVFFLKD